MGIEGINLQAFFERKLIFQESFAGLLCYQKNLKQSIDYAEETPYLQFEESKPLHAPVTLIFFEARFLFTIVQDSWTSYHFYRSKNNGNPNFYRSF